MTVALMFWGTSIAMVLVVALVLCKKIEDSGVKRWGATGSLFNYKNEEGK